MAVAYNKFEGFVNYLGLGDMHLDSDTFNVYVTNNAPSASADDVRADLAGATEENGYAAADITNTWGEASGTGTMGATDVVITAAGGAVGPFQYIVIYNDTHASDALMCWWDYGSAVTLQAGETFTIDFVDNTVCTIA
jgi:hypothetical protein